MDSTDFDLVVGSTRAVKSEVSEGSGTVPYEKAPKRAFKDRRKMKRDRRRSVREGIFVTLSVENDRRFLRDRRKATRLS